MTYCNVRTRGNASESVRSRYMVFHMLEWDHSTAETVRCKYGGPAIPAGIMQKRPFIIDCDTGTDDTIAIIAALGCEEMEIVGITSVNGNVPESYTSRNNINLMEYLGYSIPVCHGAILPLLGSKTTGASANIHGKTGLGSTELPEAEHSDFDPRIAAQFIYEEAVKRNGELELLVTGPITNIAICLCEHPDLPKYIKHLYFMGGSTVGGNVNTSAEYNIWVDPEALHVVLQSGIPMTMVGLNVSNQTEMRNEEEQMIRSYGTREGDLVADLLVYMMNRNTTKSKVFRANMHDPLALASAMFPECMKYEDYFGDTECAGTYTRGHTAIDVFRRSGKEPNVRVAVEVDVEGFREWLCERIRIAGYNGEAVRK